MYLLGGNIQHKTIWTACRCPHLSIYLSYHPVVVFNLFIRLYSCLYLVERNDSIHNVCPTRLCFCWTFIPFIITTIRGGMYNGESVFESQFKPMLCHLPLIPFLFDAFHVKLSKNTCLPKNMLW